ncbi:GFA family protein [Thalassotalea litorea]|uniref:GFA family protein n=1 Tax=Thalassotalea litorea TaxID=2020715 RepID=A0A5R9IGB7_9GAMM|nr:GFA family protein [Thalassotalea litorea]TLU64555.1 GFA family protein [Thalassotalea litorea]
MNKEINGGCCCGSVTFKLEDNFAKFFFCYCEQCRKLTGSAHAANLFTSPSNIEWIKGEEKIKRYDHPTRSFARSFCSECGSGLPYLSQSGKFLIVPAGSLNEEPSKSLDAQIFCEEQAQWHKVGLNAVKFEGFPK